MIRLISFYVLLFCVSVVTTAWLASPQYALKDALLDFWVFTSAALIACAVLGVTSLYEYGDPFTKTPRRRSARYP